MLPCDIKPQTRGMRQGLRQVCILVIMRLVIMRLVIMLMMTMQRLRCSVS